MNENESQTAELFARECSAALETLRELCEPCPPFPAPWDEVPPSLNVRQTVLEPETVLAQMRLVPADQPATEAIGSHRRFDDIVLRATNILSGAEGEEPRLNPKLCGAGRYLFAVWDPLGRCIVDFLTPLGLLSGKRYGAYTPLFPWPGDLSGESDDILGTTSTREAALLISLGFPAVILRRIRHSSFSELRRFWEPCWTAVSGCAPFLVIENSTRGPLALSWKSFHPPKLVPAHATPRTARPTAPPLPTCDVAQETEDTIDVSGQPDNAPSSQACGSTPADSAGPKCDAAKWLRNYKAGLPPFNGPVVIAGSLIGLSESPPLHFTKMFKYLHETNRRGNYEMSPPTILKLEPYGIGILQDLFSRDHTREELQEELRELFLVCGQQPFDFWPSIAEDIAKQNAPLPLSEARDLLLEALGDAKSYEAMQRAFDKYTAAVDLEVIQPLLDDAERARSPVMQRFHKQYAEALRIANVIEPFAVNNFVPRDLKIDVSFDRASPRVAFEKQNQIVLKHSQLLLSTMKRR